MFSGQLPHYIEPRKLANQGGEIKGQTTVAALPRLKDYRHSQDGEQDGSVAVSLICERDEEGRLVVRGDVTARLEMVCQRCLEPVDCDIHTNILLAMVSSETESRQLPEHYDPWLLQDERLELAGLLEEELLLALPLAPVHDQCPVAVPMSVGEPTGKTTPEDRDKQDTVKEDEINPENPFAVLARLKDRK